MSRKPIDAGDERSVKERKQTFKLIHEREVEELRQILQTNGGRAFVWRQLSRCGIFKAPLTDALETFRELGRRDIGLELLDEVFTSDAEAFIVMMREDQMRKSEGEGNDG